MGYLDQFTTEELGIELASRQNDAMLAFRLKNVERNNKLTKEVIDFLAPVHSTRCGDFSSLLSSGISYCNRCTLAALGMTPVLYEDVQVCVTVDFNLTKQMSFK